MSNSQKNARGMPGRGHERWKADTSHNAFNRSLNLFLPGITPGNFTMDCFRAADVIENEDDRWYEDEEPWRSKDNH